MSSTAYQNATEWPDLLLAGADLTGLEGHMVYVSSSTVLPTSVTNQATTEATLSLGLLLQGDISGRPVRVAAGGDLLTCIAGTGGVTAGDTLVPEFSATAANRGRLIDVATADIADNDYTVGTARQTAAAGQPFLADIRITKRHVPA